MKRLLLSTLFALALASSALAGNPYTAMGNANYTALNTDIRIIPTVALTAVRTITLPYAGGTVVGSGTAYPGGYASGFGSDRLEIIDSNGLLSASTNACLLITAQTGDLLNGVSGGTVTLCQTYGRLLLRPVGGVGWQVDSNETVTSGVCPGTATTFSSVANVVGTWTSSAPTLGLFTVTAHSMVGACPIQISGGSQSTGVSTATTYWVIPASISTNTFALASSISNALAGTALAITGSAGSGQTVTTGVPLTTATPAALTGVTLTPGEWDCRGSLGRTITATTSFTNYSSIITTTAAPAVPTQADVVNGRASNIWAAAIVPGVAVGPASVVGPVRFSFTAATNVYMNVSDTFTASTDAAGGILVCRRAL